MTIERHMGLSCIRWMEKWVQVQRFDVPVPCFFSRKRTQGICVGVCVTCSFIHFGFLFLFWMYGAIANVTNYWLFTTIDTDARTNCLFSNFSMQTLHISINQMHTYNILHWIGVNARIFISIHIWCIRFFENAKHKWEPEANIEPNLYQNSWCHHYTWFERFSFREFA